MVKRCGKSAPRSWQHGWHAKPRTEQDQIGRRSSGARCAAVARCDGSRMLRTARPTPPGRSLDPVSDDGARGMVVTPERAAGASRTRVEGEQNSAYRPAATYLRLGAVVGIRDWRFGVRGGLGSDESYPPRIPNP